MLENLEKNSSFHSSVSLHCFSFLVSVIGVIIYYIWTFFEILRKKYSSALHLVEMDTDPDPGRQTLDEDPDPGQNDVDPTGSESPTLVPVQGLANRSASQHRRNHYLHYLSLNRWKMSRSGSVGQSLEMVSLSGYTHERELNCLTWFTRGTIRFLKETIILYCIFFQHNNLFRSLKAVTASYDRLYPAEEDEKKVTLLLFLVH